MNSGRFILSQVFDLVRRQTFDRIVERYEPTSSVRHLRLRQQLTCMVFAQMTSRDTGIELFHWLDRGAILDEDHSPFGT
jgi:Domain of unknown function (DUF4372)